MADIIGNTVEAVLNCIFYQGLYREFGDFTVFQFFGNINLVIQPAAVAQKLNRHVIIYQNQLLADEKGAFIFAQGHPKQSSQGGSDLGDICFAADLGTPVDGIQSVI